MKDVVGAADSPRREGEFRYLDTSGEEDICDEDVPKSEPRSLPIKAEIASGIPSKQNSEDKLLQNNVFAVMADQYVKTSSALSDFPLRQAVSEFSDAQGLEADARAMPAVTESSSFDDSFALFGRDQGIEVVNLDPSDSEGATDDDSRSSGSEKAAPQSIAELAKKMGMEKPSRQFSAHLSSIDRGNSYGGDSSDDSDQQHFFSNYGLGSLSVSSPSRGSGFRKGLGMTMGKAPKPRLQVLTPEEKRRKREEAVRRREEMQLSQCTFRSVFHPPKAICNKVIVIYSIASSASTRNNQAWLLQALRPERKIRQNSRSEVPAPLRPRSSSSSLPASGNPSQHSIAQRSAHIT
jgi:hypothetical protein